MLVIIGKVMSIFAIMLVGLVAYRVGVAGDDAVKPLTSILMNITCPCLVVYSLYSKEISGSLFGDTLAVMAGVMIFFAFATVVTYIFLKVSKIGRKEDMGLIMVAVAATNSGFMGFPLVKSLYGSDMLYLMVMGNMMLNVYLMWIEPMILTIGNKSRVTAGDMLNAFKTPLVISLIVGFLMFFFHIRPTGEVDETIRMIGDVTVPLSMMLVGIRLGSVRIKEILSRENIVISIFAMIVIPVMVFAILYPIGIISSDVKIIIAITAALPSAVVAAVVAEQHSDNAILVSEIVSLTTLMSIITVPAAVVLIETLYR